MSSGRSGGRWQRKVRAALAGAVVALSSGAAVLATQAPVAANVPNPLPGQIGGEVRLDTPQPGQVTVTLSGAWDWRKLPGIIRNAETCAAGSEAGRYGVGWTVDWWGIGTSPTVADPPAIELTGYGDHNISNGSNPPVTMTPGGAVPIKTTSPQLYFHENTATVGTDPGGYPTNLNGLALFPQDCTLNAAGFATGTFSATAVYPSVQDLPAQLCVNLYDLHQGGASDLEIGTNPDSSISTNFLDPTMGSYCLASTSAATQQSSSKSGEGTTTVGGGAVTDTATVSNLESSTVPGPPAGTVAFYLCGPESPGVVSTCATTGTPEGTEAVRGTATDATATSAPFSPVTPGTYCFSAVYLPSTGGGTGTISTLTSAAGTVVSSTSSRVLLGLGTGFVSQLAAGDRLYDTSGGYIGTVTTVVSDTVLLLSGDSAIALAGGPIRFTSPAMTGTGTAFTSELLPGDDLFTTGGNYLGTVASIASDTALTLSAVPTTALSGAPFAYGSTFLASADDMAGTADPNECFVATAAPSTTTTGGGPGFTPTLPTLGPPATGSSAPPGPSGSTVTGATTVHTGAPWAGSRPFEGVATGLGLGLLVLGLTSRRRFRSARS